MAFTTASAGRGFAVNVQGVSRVCGGRPRLYTHIWTNHDSHPSDAISPFHPLSLPLPELCSRIIQQWVNTNSHSGCWGKCFCWKHEGKSSLVVCLSSSTTCFPPELPVCCMCSVEYSRKNLPFLPVGGTPLSNSLNYMVPNVPNHRCLPIYSCRAAAFKASPYRLLVQVICGTMSPFSKGVDSTSLELGSWDLNP